MKALGTLQVLGQVRCSEAALLMRPHDVMLVIPTCSRGNQSPGTSSDLWKLPGLTSNGAGHSGPAPLDSRVLTFSLHQSKWRGSQAFRFSLSCSSS